MNQILGIGLSSLAIFIAGYFLHVEHFIVTKLLYAWVVHILVFMFGSKTLDNNLQLGEL